MCLNLKNIIFILLIGVLVQSVRAQNGVWQLEVVSTFAASTPYNAISIETGTWLKPKFAGGTGFNAAYLFGTKYGLGTGVLYTNMGVKRQFFARDLLSEKQEISINKTYHYIDFPIFFSMNVKRFFAKTGFSLMYRFKETIKQNSNDNHLVDDYFYYNEFFPFNLGYFVSMGADIINGPKFKMGLFAEYRLNIGPEQLYKEYSRNGFAEDVYLSRFGLGVRVGYNCKRKAGLK